MDGTVATWVERWRTLSYSVLAPTRAAFDRDHADMLEGFTDERGFVRYVDRHAVWHALSDAGTPPPPLLQRDPGPSLDERLWHALTLGATPELSDIGPAGPLTTNEGIAIEVRTETELCALHALWSHAGSDAALRSRCLDAAAWHVRELQPDNATGRPWGAHVFVALASAAPNERDASAALMHADCLTHACVVREGRPDRVSAAILLHAARELEQGLG